MKKHYCGSGCRIVEPVEAGGREFVIEGVLRVATSVAAAQPGQDEPSGECPNCQGPTFCAVFGAL